LESVGTAFSGTLSENQRVKLGREVWIRLGQNLFETIQWRRWSPERITAQVVRQAGWEHVQKALDKGKGVLLVFAHLGQWELMANYISSRAPVSAVAQNLYDPRLDVIMTDFRERKLRVSMIKRGVALRGIMVALKENRIVIALVDQDTGKDGVFVPFFGKPAWTQSGVARIALKTGAALVPAFVLRGKDGHFEFRAEKEIIGGETGDRDKDILERVRRYTEVVEKYVRAYPEQWMFMHPRWKTRPPDEKKEP
jgi:KDO2-lipid IV(A) lauroyltransferase